MKNLFMTAAILILSVGAQAQQFQLIPKADSSTGVTMTIPYDLGTHHGVATQVSGTIIASQNLTQITGKLTVPIALMSTGNPTRDCHMREALGLDYTKSQFPKAHICDPNNQLPKTGPDSVVFQTVEFTLLGVTGAGDISTELKPGNTFDLTANGSWAIHGVQKNLSFPLKITVVDSNTLNVKGSIPFSLSDYGVIVKPVLGIGVKNNMTADLDILVATQK